MVDTGFLIAQLVSGLVTGMIYFTIAVGLSMIFGIMGVLNFAHGAFYMLGAILAVTMFSVIPNFYVVLVVGTIAVAIFGAITERTLIRQLYDREPIYQLLLTFGISLVLINAAQRWWGTVPELLSPPQSFSGLLEVGPIILPHYRLFIIAFGILTAVLLWFMLEKTRFGILVRAATRDDTMVQVLGHNTNVLFTSVFALGAGLAAAGGILIGPLTGIYPSMGMEVLITSFVVVIIGGLGSLAGTFIAAILIGEIMALTSIWWPAGTNIAMFTLMIAVLLLKPEGLLGESGVVE